MMAVTLWYFSNFRNPFFLSTAASDCLVENISLPRVNYKEQFGTIEILTSTHDIWEISMGPNVFF